MIKRHILIVHNDKVFIQETTKILEARNYKVDVAHNGADTLEKANQFPDLILLDRRLPDIEGLEICKRIRANSKLAHISIVILTANDTPSERVEGFSLGADDCLSKPVDPDELVARMEAVLKRNQAFRQVQEEQGEQHRRQVHHAALGGIRDGGAGEDLLDHHGGAHHDRQDVERIHHR